MMKWLNNHRTAVGYILVAAVFTGVGLATLELLPKLSGELAARGYEMQSPEYLWLMALIPILWFVRLHSLTDMPFLQQMLSATLRSAMIVAMALALTQITHVSHESKKVATVMLVDVSESVPDEVLTDAHERLQALWAAAGDEHLVRLVTFAETARVVPLNAGSEGKLGPIARHKQGVLGTDLQQAMRLAYGLYPPGRHKRMVIVTDGNETTGNAISEVATATRLGIQLHYGTLPDLQPKPEMMVVGLDVPEDIEPNVPFEVSAQLISNQAGAPARCTLKVDKLVAGVQKLDAEQGEQTIEFEKVRVREGGEHAFHVDCAPQMAEGATEEAVRTKDRFASNNTFEVTRFVKEKPRLLYVEGESMYSRNFKAALKDDFRVEVRGSTGIPRTLAEMKRFKSIVISDVPRIGTFSRENMTNRQMHRLHDYAKAGGLLIFTGGQDSLGPGGYGSTYLERRVLPVKLEVEHELETPRLALAMVIDRSGSMSGQKLELAKKAGRATVRELDKRDRVGIIAFDSAPQKLIRMTRASAKSKFDRALGKLNAGGGTAIGAALEDAFEMLNGVEAKVKHVILLTDGQSNRQGVLNLVEQAARQRITVSTIAVGAGSDRTLLRNIAEVGKGRFYYTNSPEQIPKLFVDETREVAGESIVEEPVRAVVNSRFKNLKFLRGLNLRGSPPIMGYVPTQAKRRADVVFRTTEGDPLLARWKQGKGWVYVWTSDIKNKWGRRWLHWGGFAPFWRQLVKDGIHQEKRDKEFPIEVDVARHTLRIATDAVDDKDQFIKGVTSKARITDPTGKVHEVTLTQSAAGRSEAELPVDKYGPYIVDITHTKGEQKLATSRGRIAYPYPEEHLRFEQDLTRIATLAEMTGGQANPAAASLFVVKGHGKTHRTPAWHWFLYLVLAAFLLDVFLRRVRLWPGSTVRWGGAA